MLSARPLIGITGRRGALGNLTGLPEMLSDLQYEMYLSDYSRGVLAAGGLPIWLPMDADPGDFIDRLDGLLLSGGADISPERWGASLEQYDTDPETNLPSPEPELERDEFELATYDAAAARGMAILGICRGHQIVNVGNGGSLHQHVPVHARFDEPPHAKVHEVAIEPDSLLGGLYGTSATVNSLHHQTIDTLATDLRATAHSDDGVIEGIEHRELPIVSVQWHPEMLTTRDTDPIFGWLVDTASAGL